MTRRLSGFPAAGVAGLLCAACAVGPNYRRPDAPVPAQYREPLPTIGTSPAEWKTAEPSDAIARGKWWEIFGDPVLNSLEEQVSVSNQSIAQAEAQFRGARAAARVARADLFPAVTTNPSVTRGTSRAGTSGPPLAGEAAPVVTNYSLPVDVSWEIDVFGRIRRNIEANVALAEASLADLESVKLAMHAELATDYFLLRGADAQIRLVGTTAAGYETYRKMTAERHQQGVVSGVDVAQAETQLYTTRVQLTDLSLSRAQFEHAIAILTGRAPGDFRVEPLDAEQSAPPSVPVVLPSELLERRPEIAASERRVAAANAQVGVATAAFFPRLLLTASGGYGASSLADWFTLPSRFWSIGAAAFATLFQGGKLRAEKEQAYAAYDADVAAYRLTVLTAFQQVEDNLAAIRILSEEAVDQTRATEAAERALTLARQRYTGGITSYLEVVISQVAALANERLSVDLQTRRLNASVNLVKALGGGWTAAGPAGEGAAAAGSSSSGPPSR